MKNNVLISIVVPIFNSEKTLKYCLDSIVNQKYTNFEVLMVDDGSTDKSANICEEYKNKDSRFVYIKKTNGGVSSARNFALKRSKGNFICFVDSDDTINENYLYTAMKTLINTDSDIFITDFNMVYNHEKVNEIRIKKKSNYMVLNNEDFLVRLVDGKGIGSGCINKVYKRQILNNIKFEPVAVAEDLKFNFDVIKTHENLKIFYSKTKLYNYFLNSNSVMHGVFSKKNLDVIRQYDILISESDNLYKKFNKAIKLSFVFICCKLIIKMVSSSYYDEIIFNKCKNIIDMYKKDVYRSSEYSTQKKIFLMFINIFYKNIITSYDKNNNWKKICSYINMKVG